MVMRAVQALVPWHGRLGEPFGTGLARFYVYRTAEYPTDAWLYLFQ